MHETERQAEIERLERELLILRERHANLDRGGGRLRIFSYAVPIVLGVLAGAFIVGLFLKDPVAAIVVVAVVLLSVLVALAVSVPYARIMEKRVDRPIRWIDYADFFGVGIWRFAVRQSEASAVEDMVAERTERLARLRGNEK